MGAAPTLRLVRSAAAVVGGVNLYTWGSTPGMVADVQGWLDQPGANFGWILIGDETGPQTVKNFASREHPELALRHAADKFADRFRIVEALAAEEGRDLARCGRVGTELLKLA